MYSTNYLNCQINSRGLIANLMLLPQKLIKGLLVPFQVNNDVNNSTND